MAIDWARRIVWPPSATSSTGTCPSGLRARWESWNCSPARRFTATYSYGSALSARPMRTLQADDERQ